MRAVKVPLHFLHINSVEAGNHFAFRKLWAISYPPPDSALKTRKELSLCLYTFPMIGTLGNAVASSGGEGSELSHAESGAESKVVKQVLSYFLRNPKAADNLGGIARWRLLEEQIQNSLSQTEAALDWLVSEGYLKEFRVAGSERSFRLNQERSSDAIRFLERGNKAARRRKR